jgi:hypothetical protein
VLSLISMAYGLGLSTGALLPDDDAVWETAEAVRIAEEGGDDATLEVAQTAHGLVFSRRATAAERDVALGLLRRARDAQIRRRILLTATIADIGIVELTAQPPIARCAPGRRRKLQGDLVGSSPGVGSRVRSLPAGGSKRD